MGKLKSVSYTDRKWGNARLIGPAVSVPVNMGRQVYNPRTLARQEGKGARRVHRSPPKEVQSLWAWQEQFESATWRTSAAFWHPLDEQPHVLH